MLYRRENPHGGDIYRRPVRLDFSVNTNPLGTPPAVVRAVEESAGELDRYPDPSCRALVGALAEYEDVPERFILCGGGAAELIFSYCAALRPRSALELAPTFSEYAAALQAVGCRVERYALTEEAIFLCTPNNPTGRLADPDLLAAVCGICRRRGLRLFVDECFLELSDGGRGASLAGWLERFPGLFLLRAFTKSYAMAGLRLGYCLCADGALLEAMGALTQPWNVSLPAQAAGLAALGERDWPEKARDLIRRERPRLAAGLAGMGLRVCPSDANYLLLQSPVELAAPLLERGILVRSCANYPGLGPGWYRAAVRRPEENEALLGALAEVLRDCSPSAGYPDRTQ